MPKSDKEGSDFYEGVRSSEMVDITWTFIRLLLYLVSGAALMGFLFI